MTAATAANDTHERIVMLIRTLLCELELAHEAADTTRLALMRDGLAALVESTRGTAR